jgi:hypothetical protein
MVRGTTLGTKAVDPRGCRKCRPPVASPSAAERRLRGAEGRRYPRRNVIARSYSQGICWWCGAPASSSEHTYKKTDLVREFGPGPYKGRNALIRNEYTRGSQQVVQARIGKSGE